MVKSACTCRLPWHPAGIKTSIYCEVGGTADIFTPGGLQLTGAALAAPTCAADIRGIARGALTGQVQ